MRQYSEWETMKRVWDVEEIKDLMSRRQFTPPMKSGNEN